MLTRLLSLIIGIVWFIPVLTAQNNYTIVDHITSVNGNQVKQPEKLAELLIKVNDAANINILEEAEKNITTGKSAGYRVQIFSDNNSRTAKNEARTKSRLVGDYFPHHRTYVQYNSPYWRVKVGDFKTQREAEEAMDEIKKAFPNLSKEIRVVKDRINVSGN